MCPICFFSAAAILLAACLLPPKREPLETPPPALSEAQSFTVHVLTDGEIKELPLEEYIAGVLAAEMPASFELEALKAQAVAARTYAVRRMSDPCGDGYDVCALSSCCQSYDRPDEQLDHWGERYEANSEKLRLAAEATAGLILTYGGAPIEALYHSTSGGFTENSENVFSAALPYLVSVESPGEEDAPRFETEATFTRRELEKALNAAFPSANLDRKRLEKEIEILSRYKSGRVEKVRLNETTVTGRELRKALSLNSASFSFEFSDESVTVTVRGFGHGVGMSQLGADAMAANGATFDEILLHYYTGVSLTPYGG